MSLARDRHGNKTGETSREHVMAGLRNLAISIHRFAGATNIAIAIRDVMRNSNIAHQLTGL